MRTKLNFALKLLWTLEYLSFLIMATRVEKVLEVESETSPRREFPEKNKPIERIRKHIFK